MRYIIALILCLALPLSACAAGSIVVVKPNPTAVTVTGTGPVLTVVVPGPQGPEGPMLTQDVNEFAMTPTGFVANNAQLHAYIKQGQSVTLQITPFTGTSNSTSLTIGTLPANLRPYNPVSSLVTVYDNNIVYLGRMYVNSTGVISFYKDFQGGVFTASGTKGVATLMTVTYITN